MPRQGSIVLCNTGWLGRPAGVDSNGDGDEWIDVLLAQLPLDQCRHFVIPSSTSCTACLLRPVPFDVRLHIKRPLLSLSLSTSHMSIGFPTTGQIRRRATWWTLTLTDTHTAASLKTLWFGTWQSNASDRFSVPCAQTGKEELPFSLWPSLIHP